VVVDNTKVEYNVPVAIAEPPTGKSYQLIVPEEDVAPIVTIPGPHVEPGVVPVILIAEYIAAVTDVRLDVVQPLSVAST